MTALSLILLLYVATACFIYIILIIKIWNKEEKVRIATVFVRGIMLILPVNVAVEVCLHNRSLEHCHQLHCIRLRSV